MPTFINNTDLKVESVQFYPKENAKIHKTKKFDVIHAEDPIAIYRRGFNFNIGIKFCNSNFNPKVHSLSLVFYLSLKSTPSNRTKACINLELESKRLEDQQNWGANILNHTLDSANIEIYIPTSVPVGLWSLQVVINSASSSATVTDFLDKFYILFNPWKNDDQVYMPQVELLDEYVLADVGKIWMDEKYGREWIFGQFDPIVLRAAIFLLKKSQLPYIYWSDPVKVTRTISKMVNCNNDGGVLVGRWNEKYDDGTSPFEWIGSSDILEKYMESKSNVKYGQCWVYAGVVTTLCRALGIPSRVVTNIMSAHDYNGSLSIDKYYDEAGNQIIPESNSLSLRNDLVWNFHVWNDVWMARPDLPAGYGGWQAIDATPQEESQGFIQCGPASLEAIKNGQVGFNYDVAFMISQVNADYINWIKDSNSELGYKKKNIDQNHIGKMILTKKPFVFDDSNNCENITLQYKAMERTEEERFGLYNAVKQTPFAKRFYDLVQSQDDDILLNLEEIDQIKLGESFGFSIKIKNTNLSEKRTVKLTLSVSSVYYNGVKANLIIKNEARVVVEPKSKKTFKMVVDSTDYLTKLVELCNMKLCAIAVVEETNQTWLGENDFQVLKPQIKLQVESTGVVGQELEVTLSFVNPLNMVLTNCAFQLSGPTLLKNCTTLISDVNANSLAKTALTIVPKVKGEQKLVAIFSSKQLTNLSGSKAIIIHKST